MKNQRQAIAVVAFILMTLALVETAQAASHFAPAARSVPPKHAAFIYNLGVDDFAGFRIAVDASGKAWAIDGGGKTSGELQSDVVRRFFSDLTAAGPLQMLPSQACPAVQPGVPFMTNVNAPLIVTWNGRSSPDLRCASDQRAQNLRFDAGVIQRALAVQSYRVRTTVLGESNASNSSSSYQPGSSASQSSRSYLSDYAFDGNGFTNTNSQAGYSGTGNYGSGFSAGRFSNEPFSNGGFSTTRFSDGGFSNERFTNGAFNNGGFGMSDFRSETFNSSFTASFNSGNFGAGAFGGGNFTTPAFTNGGFGGGGFGGGNFTTYPVP